MPDVPSAQKWTPKQFKDAITKPLFDNENSFYAYYNELATDLERYIDEFTKEYLLVNPTLTGNEEVLLGIQVEGVPYQIKRTIFNLSSSVSEASALILRQISIDGDVWKLPDVDSFVSATSTNAVQNKAIKKYVDDLIASIKQATAPDGTMSDTSANAVQNKVIKSYVDNLIKSTDTSLRTNINLVRQDTIKYADNVEKVCKAYTDGKITRANLVTIIGDATERLNGLMSVSDKQAIETLKAMLVDGDENSIVDKIQEILWVFRNYPEGTDLFTLLAEKANKEDVYTKDEVDVKVEELKNRITIGYELKEVV